MFGLYNTSASENTSPLREAVEPCNHTVIWTLPNRTHSASGNHGVRAVMKEAEFVFCSLQPQRYSTSRKSGTPQGTQSVRGNDYV